MTQRMPECIVATSELVAARSSTLGGVAARQPAHRSRFSEGGQTAAFFCRKGQAGIIAYYEFSFSFQGAQAIGRRASRPHRQAFRNPALARQRRLRSQPTRQCCFVPIPFAPDSQFLGLASFGIVFHIRARSITSGTGGSRREAIFADDDGREFRKTQTQKPARMVKFSQTGANVAKCCTPVAPMLRPMLHLKWLIINDVAPVAPLCP